jgi:poly-gamma-glutamate capsule biosynthesis protein CapA/YwtB (metallophosphatase superfamily)
VLKNLGDWLPQTQQQKTNEQSTDMLLRLLSLCCAFLFLSWGQLPSLPEHTDALPSVAPKVEESKKENPNSLDLIFIGDIMSQATMIQSAQTAPNNYDFRPWFKFVKPIFGQADLVVGNLELTMPGHPPYTGYPNFRTPDQLAPALKDAGFDVLVGANNHACDGGREGVEHTAMLVRNQKILQTGTFHDMDERNVFHPLVIYKRGFKIALVNYTMHTNGLSPLGPNVVNRINEAQIERDMAMARDLKPDIIVAFMHWGEEYHLDENSDQQALAARIRGWGADVVIGSHPHVIQPVKEYTIERDGKTHRCVTAYSLGNFISSQPYQNTEGGLMLHVQIERDSSGAVLVKDYRPETVYRYVERRGDKTTYHVLPTNFIPAEMPAADRFKMEAFRVKMAKHLMLNNKNVRP